MAGALKTNARAAWAALRTLKRVNCANKTRNNVVLGNNGAVGDGLSQSFILYKRLKAPFADQWSSILKLSERIKCGSCRINIRCPIIVIDDCRAFPSDTYIGGERACCRKQWYSESRTDFVATVLVRSFVE